jgi:tetratricopeptide (TPR) repeat protein
MHQLLILFHMLFLINVSPFRLHFEPESINVVNAEEFLIMSQKYDTIADYENFRKRLRNEYSEKANKISDYYLKAQRALYRDDFDKALEEIDRALEIHKNADLLALKGSIYFSMKSFTEATVYWQEALKLDKNLPIPHIKGLKQWLTESGLMP